MEELISVTGTKKKDFHLIGHGLGAHVSAFASDKIGSVGRITGLDPAQPCFISNEVVNYLDKTDADFVDIIHTNGRILSQLRHGLQKPSGHQDFYPNGGIRQPGCKYEGKVKKIGIPVYDTLQRGICNHGRAYKLFTESIQIETKCLFIGRKWDMTYEGIDTSFSFECTKTLCSVMGLHSFFSPARGSFFVVTSSRSPFCIKNACPKDLRTSVLLQLQKVTGKNKLNSCMIL
ncbi:phospholipase A1-like [Arctopsyche grandis]|uniref:phospholipase A1-like n=1 Tax=Arctopsyche grandis TaxID=121162 RepID=UPI00406D7DFC